ncbi:MAG: hypothetical protein HYZ16_11105 [Bacteroidetes bacterium]|jgi:hypothetical protein|nr:hypothetical protein [Bacteroidota bacterium]
MPLLLLKTKAQSPAPCGGALFLCLALALWLPGSAALAQNLVRNPSFKKYTGEGLPCNGYREPHTYYWPSKQFL